MHQEKALHVLMMHHYKTINKYAFSTTSGITGFLCLDHTFKAIRKLSDLDNIENGGAYELWDY